MNKLLLLAVSSVNAWRFLLSDYRCRLPTLPAAPIVNGFGCSTEYYRADASCCAPSLPQRAFERLEGALRRRKVYKQQLDHMMDMVRPQIQGAVDQSVCLRGVSNLLDARKTIVDHLNGILESAEDIMKKALGGAVCDACLLPAQEYDDQAMQSNSFIARAMQSQQAINTIAENDNERLVADACWMEQGLDLNLTMHKIGSHDRIVRMRNRHWGFRRREKLLDVWSEWVERVTTTFSVGLSALLGEVTLLVSAISPKQPSFMKLPHPNKIDDKLAEMDAVSISPIVEYDACYEIIRLSDRTDPRLPDYVVPQASAHPECLRIYVEETDPGKATRQTPLHLARIKRIIENHSDEQVRKRSRFVWRRYPASSGGVEHWSGVVGGQYASIFDMDDPKFLEKFSGSDYKQWIPMKPNLGKAHDMSDAAMDAATSGPNGLESDCPDLQRMWTKAMTATKRLVYGCYEVSYCGGHGDRFHGILSSFVLALLTGRRLYIDSRHPVPLDAILRGHWKLPLADVAQESARYSFVDNTEGFLELLPKLMEESARMVIVNTNLRLHSLLARHDVVKDIAAQRWGLDVPYLAHCIWDFLFAAQEDLHKSVMDTMLPMATYYGDVRNIQPPQYYGTVRGFPIVIPYLAMHFRAGNESQGRWTDPARHSLSQLNMFLECAKIAEDNRRLNIYGEMPWYLSADIPMDTLLSQFDEDSLLKQYVNSGKLFFNQNSDREVVHVDRSETSFAIEGFLDSWSEYYLLANAHIIVMSNSFFGETAAELGRIQQVYYFDGCFPVDLSGA